MLENIESVKEHGKCENAKKSVACILFCGFSL